jgi:hypothetical protein
MNNLAKLGFDNWFWESSVRSPLDFPSGKDKIDLSKPSDLKIARVISVNPQTPSTRRAKTALLFPTEQDRMNTAGVCEKYE